MVAGSVGVRRNGNNEAIVVGRRYVSEMVVSTERPRGTVSTLLFLERVRRAAAAEVQLLNVRRHILVCVCETARLHNSTSSISELSLAANSDPLVHRLSGSRGDKNLSHYFRIISAYFFRPNARLTH